MQQQLQPLQGSVFSGAAKSAGSYSWDVWRELQALLGLAGPGILSLALNFASFGGPSIASIFFVYIGFIILGYFSLTLLLN